MTYINVERTLNAIHRGLALVEDLVPDLVFRRVPDGAHEASGEWGAVAVWHVVRNNEEGDTEWAPVVAWCDPDGELLEAVGPEPEPTLVAETVLRAYRELRELHAAGKEE